jgi:hypothetical protein
MVTASRRDLRSNRRYTSLMLLASLTPAQRGALRRIVDDWIREGFQVPPYSPAYYDIFEALDLAEPPGFGRGYDTRRPVNDAPL